MSVSQRARYHAIGVRADVEIGSQTRKVEISSAGKYGWRPFRFVPDTRVAIYRHASAINRTTGVHNNRFRAKQRVQSYKKNCYIVFRVGSFVRDAKILKHADEEE